MWIECMHYNHGLHTISPSYLCFNVSNLWILIFVAQVLPPGLDVMEELATSLVWTGINGHLGTDQWATDCLGTGV